MKELTTKDKKRRIIIASIVFVLVVVVIAVFSISSSGVKRTSVPNMVTTNSDDPLEMGSIDPESADKLISAIPQYLSRYIKSDANGAKDIEVSRILFSDISEQKVELSARADYTLDGKRLTDFYFIFFNKVDGVWQEPTFQKWPAESRDAVLQSGSSKDQGRVNSGIMVVL